MKPRGHLVWGGMGKLVCPCARACRDFPPPFRDTPQTLSRCPQACQTRILLLYDSNSRAILIDRPGQPATPPADQPRGGNGVRLILPERPTECHAQNQPDTFAFLKANGWNHLLRRRCPHWAQKMAASRLTSLHRGHRRAVRRVEVARKTITATRATQMKPSFPRCQPIVTISPSTRPSFEGSSPRLLHPAPRTTGHRTWSTLPPLRPSRTEWRFPRHKRPDEYSPRLLHRQTPAPDQLEASRRRLQSMKKSRVSRITL